MDDNNREESTPSCCICLSEARYVYQANCGHVFCNDCLKTLKRCENVCPQDDCPLRLENLELVEYNGEPNDGKKCEERNHDVKCPNHVFGCHSVVKIWELEEHIEDCCYEQISCPHSCSKILNRQDIGDHIKVDCENRPVQCSICKQFKPLKDIENHQQTSCLHASCYCEHCSMKLERYELARHVSKDCKLAPVSCSFSEFGCQEKIKRCELVEHLEKNKEFHNAVLSETINKRVKKEIEHAQPMNYRRSSCDAAISSSPVGVFMDRETFPFDDQQNLLFSSSFRNGSLRTACIDELFSRIVVLEQKNCQLEFEMKEMGQRMSDREREIERKFCYGTFRWNVDNFNAYNTEALNGNPTVIHSPSFYTTPCGYKLCLRMNFQITKMQPNNVSISMFVHFMPGEYDEDLPWPFMGHITMSIVNPLQPDTFHSISNSMKSDPHKTAFQRPEPNVPRSVKGFGYSEFTSVDELEKGKYIMDGRVIVKVKIETISDTGHYANVL